jgi:tRNA A-37 threonylcarbamoyl transferase component Bud32
LIELFKNLDRSLDNFHRSNITHLDIKDKNVMLNIKENNNIEIFFIDLSGV